MTSCQTCLTAVGADMDQPIVSPGPEHARLVRRLDQGEDGGEGLGADRVEIDRTAGGFSVSGSALRQIGADRLPGLSLVGALEDDVAADIERVRIVRRDDDRVGPGEAVFVLAGAVAAIALRPGGDQADLVALAVVALERVAAAGRGADRADVDDVRIVRAGPRCSRFRRCRRCSNRCR